jgi:sporulation integral membrane protein YlbJ
VKTLFGVGPSGATALVLGLVGGYPVGARTIAQLRERGECTGQEARRLALFCNNCGPAFFLGAAGAGVFGSRRAGVLLLAANGLAAVLVGLALCRVPRFSGGGPGSDRVPAGRTERHSLAEVFPQAVQSAFSSALGVCAYVLLFSVLTSLAQATGILPWCAGKLGALLPGPQGETLARAFLLGLLEISTGTAALQPAAGTRLALPLAAFLLGWGGLSVHGQSLPFLTKAGADVRGYLWAKLLQGVAAAGITAVLSVWFPLALPAMAGRGIPGGPSLLGRELLALWGLAGLVWLGNKLDRRQKRGGNDRAEGL